MKFIQTFWSAGLDPLKHGFGWSHPEYNLMSWALSCLSLRRHYDHVVLYTDSIGKHVLIDLLHLPYTEVNVVFDDFECLPQHWALAKIYTYSLQKEPFIHVYGDVYLSHPLSNDVLSAPLVAQNKEVGTDYYQNMINRIVNNPNIKLPDCIGTSLSNNSLFSYNMGIFGGTNVSFIGNYCCQACEFINANGINDVNNENSRIDCNVFFEQILFASLVENGNLDVSCIVNHQLIDNGYTIEEFCNLFKFNEYALFHLLGGHKRNKRVLNMLKHYVILNLRSLFLEITKLIYPIRISMRNNRVISWGGDDSLDCFVKYVNVKLDEWRKNGIEKEIQIETNLANSITCIEKFMKNDRSYGLYCVPSLVIYSFGKTLDANRDADVFRWFNCSEHFPLKDIAITRAMIGDDYAMEPLTDTEMKIIHAIRSGRRRLADVAEYCMPINLKETARQKRYHHILTELKYLIENEIVYINKIN